MSTNEVLFQKDKLHHAYLLIGDITYWRESLGRDLKKILQVENLSACPDVWWLAYDSFGVKDSHNLIEKEARKSFAGQGRFFILEISSITPEAQNALLKTLEEPMSDTHFFIIARTADIFLPTIRSRMLILTQAGDGSVDKTPAAKNFLKLDLPDRLDYIQKEFLKNKDKTKSEIIDFVTDLEKTLRSKIDIKKMTKDEEISLFELEKCQHYLQNPRSSNRLILEHLALILPIFKDKSPERAGR